MASIETQDQHAVYLLDPGPRSAGIMGLLQEITGQGAAQCAEIVRTPPSFVVSCQSRAAADDVAARLREFDAIAIVRPASQPLREGTDPDPLGSDAPPAIPWALAILGVLQMFAAVWWILSGRLLSGIGGLILGVAVLAASVISLTRARRA